MAVQKSKKSRSRRDMRRSHDNLDNPTCSADSTTGIRHLRHHIGKDGYYKGKEIFKPKEKKDKQEEQQQ